MVNWALSQKGDLDKLNRISNISGMVHTHELELHLSTGDLASLFARFSRGEITSYVNFKYTIVSPEYFVVINIDNPDRMSALINEGFLAEKADGKKVLSKKYLDMYDKHLPMSSNSIEGHFQNFVDFANEANLGLKFINNREDVEKLLNKIESCIR